jgi:hypothetical protein
MLFVYILQLSKDTYLAKRIVVGFIAATIVSISISIYQRLEMSGLAIPFNFLHQSLNPSYNHGIGEGRMNFPFSEPSYASVWYSGLLLGGLAIHLFSRPCKTPAPQTGRRNSLNL